MVKDLDDLRAKLKEGRETADVDVGPPFGTITVRQLSAKKTLELLAIWKNAGLVKVIRDPDGSQTIDVAVDEETLDVDAALMAFTETVVAAAVGDDGNLLFQGDDGRALAAELPMDVLGKLANAAMKLGETKPGK